MMAVAMAISGVGTRTWAASVTLKTSDAINTTSYTGNTNWSDNTAPSSANDYLTGAFGIRTPASGTGNFAGNSLSIDAGGGLTFKTVGPVTNSWLKLNGGNLGQGSSGATPDTVALAGTISVLAPSFIDLNSAGRNILLTATITNTASLRVTNTVSFGAGLLILNDNNLLYSGNWMISTGSFVQLGLSNGVGGLGTGIVTNNGNLIFYRTNDFTNSNVIVGSGGITKSNAQVVVLAGNNSFTGGVTNVAGTLRLAHTNALGASNGLGNTVVLSGATLDLNSNIVFESINIAGAGVGSAGAMLNNGASLVNNGMKGILTLTAAATIGGSGRWDILPPGNLNCGGFKLTKAGANEIALENLPTASLADVDITAGTLTILGTMVEGTAANTISISSGATLNYFAVNNTLATPLSKVIVVQSGGNWNNNNGLTYHTGSVTLQGVANFAGSGTAFTNLGPVGGAGSVVKSGTTITALVGTNTFTGNITVNQGTLVLGRPATIYQAPLITLASGAILDVMMIPEGLTLANSAVLTGSGVVTGSVTLTPSAILLPGSDGGASTLTITNGSLTLQHQSVLRLDLSTASTAAGGGVNDLVALNGNLNLAGNGTTFVSFNFLGGNAPLPGPYTLIRYSGALTGGASNFVALSHLGAVFDTTSTPGEIRVTFTGSGSNLVWKGDGLLNRWDNGISTNWLNNLLPDLFYPGDSVTLDNTGSNNVAVNVPAPVSPAAIRVTADKDYTISGAGSITSGNLTKSGLGTLTLSTTTNSYSGGTVVSGGTLKLGASNAMGAAASTIVVTNGGQIDLNGIDQGSRGYTYFASGAGPDGQGAIKTTSATSLDGSRSGIKNLTLVGDTTLGTIGGRFDIGSGGGVNGQGFQLTKVGTAIMPYRGAVSNVSQLNINAGRFYGEQLSMQFTSVVNIAAGASLGGYSYTNSSGQALNLTNTATINLNGGTLGAEGAQSTSSGPVVWTGPVNVNADSFLNPAQGNGNTDAQLDGSIFGSRSLTVVPGTGTTRAIVLSTNNDATFTGNWTIVPSGVLRLAGTNGSFGNGIVTNNGTVQLLRTAPSLFAGSVRGGVFEHMAGSEQVTITGTNFVNQLKPQSVNSAKPLILDNGSLTIVSNIINLPNDNSYGKMQINSGATLTALKDFYMGGEAASRTGEVVQVGGTVVVNGQFRLAHWGTEVSTYRLLGGSLTLPTLPPVGNNPTVQATETNGVLYVGIDGIGLFTQSGGTLDVSAMVLDGRGPTTLAPFTNTYSMEGGRLVIGPFGIRSGTSDSNPNYIINLGGGTVAASADWISSRNMNISGTNGSVTFDPGPNTITLSGANAGPGGLNKNGAGTLVLSGPSSYTNNTVVNAGTLLANGIIGTNSGSLTVAGGVLGGSGQILTPVTVNSGATLTAGTNGVAGTLVISNHLTLNSGARLAFDLGSTTNIGANDLLLLRSNVTLAGSVPVSFNFLAGTPNTTQPYTIAQIAGTQSGVPDNLTAPSHYGATFSVSSATNLQVQFSGAASNLTWIGDGAANIWQAGGPLNWSNGLAMDFFGSGDSATFDNNGSNNVPVTISGLVSPSSVTVNANKDYNFAGQGRIAGSGGLTKVGTGTLILTNSHDYTGNTVISNGTVVIAGDSSLGTAPGVFTGGKLVLNGGVLQAVGTFALNANRGILVGPSAGTINVASGNTLISGGIITNNGAAAGALVKTGLGLLRVTSANAFTGDATISQGPVVIYNNNSLGSNNTIRLGDANTGSADVELLLEGQTGGFGYPRPIVVSASAGGNVRLGSTLGSATNPQFNNSVTLNRNVTLVGTNTDRTTFAGPIGGTGDISIAGPNRVVLAATNTFIGNIIISNGSTLQIGAGSTLIAAIPDASSVLVDTGATFSVSVNTEAMDALNGSGVVQAFSPAAAPATLTVGANGGNGTFNGLLTNGNSTFALTKAGSGTQILGGTNTYTGNTVVNGGILALAATASISNSAQISVNSNAIFDATAPGGYRLNDGKSVVGNGGIIKGNFTVASNATLSVNGFAAAGVLSFSNNLTMLTGSIMNVNFTNNTALDPNQNDLLVVGGDLVISGAVRVILFPLSGNLAVGTYRLINYGGSLIGNPTNLIVSNNSGSTRYTYAVDTNVPGQVNLIVSNPSLAGNLLWNGNVNANWNINTDPNWLSGLVADRFFNGDAVQFDDTAAQYNVALPGTVLSGPIIVNSSFPYSISGAGKISGTSPLTKSGVGTLTLSTINDFTGAIQVNGGVLKAGASNAFGLTTGITIANGAQVDINGITGARANAYTMAGFGPDGRGALICSTGGPHGPGTSPVGAATLTGNAGVWAAPGQVWDFVSSVFDGRGFKLTKYGAGRLDFNTSRVTNLDELIVAEGIVYSEGTFAGALLNDNFGTNATVMSGAILAQFGNVFANTRVTLNGGMLGTCGNSTTQAIWNGPITLASNSIMGYLHIFNSAGTFPSNAMQVNGVISGPGSLTKIGIDPTGFGGATTNMGTTLFLAATNTYTGNTIIQEGRIVLLPTGSISNSPIITIVNGASNVFDVTAVPGFGLAPGQTLAGGGTVLGAVQVPSGAFIQPGGIAGYGTLTLSNTLTLNGGTPLVFDLNTLTNEGGVVNDLLVLTNLTVTVPTAIRVNPLAGSFSNATYTLINYNGTLTGSGNLSVEASVPGVTATLDFAVAGKIRVVFSGTPSAVGLEWLAVFPADLPTDTNWNVGLTLNWYDGSSQVAFFPANPVTFNDSWGSIPTVNLVGTLAPGSITIASDANQYVFTGSGSLGGSGGLTKKGTSLLTFLNSGTNNYAGPTDIQFGNIQVGNGGIVGNLPPTPITNGTALFFNRSDSNTVPNLMVGSGALYQQGPGVLTLSGASGSTYNGPITINGGSLRPAASGAVGSTNTGAAAITVAAGSYDVNGVNIGVKPISIIGTGNGGSGAVINGGASQLNAFFNFGLAGNASVGGFARWDVRGTGSVVNLNGYTLTKTGTNNIYLVTSLVGDGNITVNQGALGIEQGATATNSPGSNGVITANAGTLGFGNFGSRLNVTRPIVMNGAVFQGESGSTDVDVDSPITLNTNTTFDILVTTRLTNVISGPGRLLKANTGVLVLGGENTYAGPTFVNAGTLQIGTNGTGSIQGDIVNYSTVDFANTSATIFGGKITGTGGTINQSRGPLRLTNHIAVANVNAQSGNFANALTFASGTSNTITGTLSIGQGVASGLSGSLVIETNTYFNAANFMIGQQNTVPGQIVQLGGDIFISAQFRIGHWPNEVSTYLMGGGSLQITNAPGGSVNGGTEQNGVFYIGIDGVGLFTQTGGVITANALVMDHRAGTPAVSGSVSTYGLEGGSLILGTNGIRTGSSDANTTYLVYLGGGTIGSSASWFSPLNMILSGTNGDLTIDTGVFTNTFTGVLGGVGGIKKNGTGALILNGVNNYLGTTLVNAGTLAGTGTIIGPVLIQSPATLSPGNTGIGTLTINNTLSLNGRTVMEISKNNGLLTSDLVRGVSTLTFGGSLTVATLANAPALAGGDTFTLFTATTYTGAFSSTNLPALTPGLVWDTTKLGINGSITVAAPPLIVSVTPASQTVECSSNATFTVSAGGTANFYQWFFGAAPVPGGISPVLTLTNVSLLQSGSYTVRVTNAVGSVIGGPVTLLVQDTTAPTITTCVSNQNLTAAAGVCQAVLPDYRSSLSVTDACGTVTITQTPAAGTVLPLGASNILFTVADPSGNTTTCSATITVVEPLPTISQQPVGSTNIVGSTATFTVVASSCATTNFQWYFGTNSLQVTNLLTDRTNTTLTLVNVGYTNVGSYLAVVSSTAGSVTSSVAILAVPDITAPIIGCSTNIAVECTNSLGTVVSYTVTATDDLDPSPVVVCSPVSGSAFPSGTTTVNCSAGDQSRNTNVCSFTVLVGDTTAPVVILNGSASMTIECHTTFVNPGAAALDGCDGVLTVSVSGSVNANVPGIYTLTNSATDTHGNSASALRTVTVVDTLAPLITCSTNRVLECTNGAGDVATFVVTSIDACDASAAVVCNPASGSVFALGTNTVNCFTYDASLNTNTCSFQVVVLDTTAPVITLFGPSSITVECHTGYSDAGATALDACAGSLSVTTTGSVDANTPAVYILTYVADDGHGNSSTNHRTVTVSDTIAPVITMAGGSSVTNECHTPYNDSGISALDACAGNVPFDTTGTVNANVPGVYPLTYHAGDLSGNTNTATRMVYVVDTTAPIIVCSTNRHAAATGLNGAAVNFVTTATDACDPAPVVTCSPTNGFTFPIGTNTVNCSAQDAAAHISTCSFLVIVTEGALPVITCSTNRLVECTNSGGTVVQFTTTAFDESDPHPTVTCTPASGSAFTVGTNTVNCTAENQAGGISSCSFLVTVRDTAPPLVILTGPASVTNECHTAYLDAGATALDGCAGTVAVTSNSTVDPNVPGSYLVTYTAQDGNGNTGTVTRVVVVRDTIAPVITLTGPASVTNECHTAYVDAGASALDACAGIVPATSTSTVDTSLPGTYAVTYTADDGRGNTGTVSRVVVVRDTIAPVITLTGPASVTNECHTAYVDAGATASDACAGTLPLATSSTVNTNVPGTYSVTYTANDGNGNSTSVSRTVVVRDSIPPVITITGPSSVTNECHTAYVDAGATASDSCGGGQPVSPLSNVNPNVPGTYSVTYTANDGNGNSATATRTVVIRDSIPPVITITGPLSLTNECHTAYLDAGASASDSCAGSRPVSTFSTVNTNLPGTYSVTYTADDGNGNTGTVSRTVVVRDTIAPVITITGAASVTNECHTPYSDPGATSSDSCAGAVTVITTGSVNINVPGSYTLTYTATDPSGNATTATRTVTIRDTTPPVLTLIGPGTVTNECHTGYVDSGVNGSDACAGPVIVTPSGSVNQNVPGTYTLTYTAVDLSGNSSVVHRTVVIRDTTPPVIALTGGNSVTAECHVPFTDPGATASDSCAGSVGVTSSGSVNVNVPGTYTLTYTATDSSGNTATSTRSVVVTDTIGPVIVLTGSAFVTVECHTSYTDAGATATDACSGPATVSKSGTVNVNQLGTYTITYSATDTHGNTSTATRSVEVVDTTGPVITLVGGSSINVECHTSFSDPGSSATDSCAGSEPVSVSGTVNPNVPGIYFLTYSTADSSGNFSASVRVVNVIDTIAPVITLTGPASVSVVCHTGYTDAGATAADACAGAVSVLTSGSVNTNQPGDYTLTYTAADLSGNTSTATRLVHVVDTTAPVIVCSTNRVVECTNGAGDVVLFTVLATDACAGAVTVVCNPASGSVFALGTNTVSCIAYDASLNTNTCSFKVIVLDTTAPVITLTGSASVTVECHTGYSDAGATALDACAGSLAVTTTGSVDANIPGTYVLTYTANDGHGNSATNHRTITVSDTIGPVLGVCPTNQTICTSSNSARAVFTAPTATDACSGSATVVCTPASGGNFPLGTNTVNCVAQDTAGNSSACSFQVVVFKGTSPTIGNLAYTGGHFSFTFPTVNGCSYVVEYKNSIGAATWTTLTTVAGDGSVKSVTDNTPAPFSRFYRVRLL